MIDGFGCAIASEAQFEVGLLRRHRALAHGAHVTYAEHSAEPIRLTIWHPSALNGLTGLLAEQRVFGLCGLERMTARPVDVRRARNRTQLGVVSGLARPRKRK